jgi:hypothetical protein
MHTLLYGLQASPRLPGWRAAAAFGPKNRDLDGRSRPEPFACGDASCLPLRTAPGAPIPSSVDIPGILAGLLAASSLPFQFELVIINAVRRRDWTCSDGINMGALVNRLFRWPRLALDDSTRAAVMMALAGAAISLTVRRGSPQPRAGRPSSAVATDRHPVRLARAHLPAYLGLFL